MNRRSVSIFLFGRWALIVGALLVLAAPAAEAQLVVYDDFIAPKLDQSKWVGRLFVVRDGGTGVLMETQRVVTAGQTLVLQGRAVGGRTSDDGSFTVENALAFRRPNAFTDISFVVWVRSLELAGCDAGDDSEAGARGVFALFNDGSGDVVATLDIRRSSDSDAPEGELEVVAALTHRSAEGETEIGSVDLGPAVVGQRVRLRMRWEEARTRVRFQRDALPLVAIDYTNAVASTPALPRKYLATTSTVGDCTAAASNADVTAVFNNVRVNP